MTKPIDAIIAAHEQDALYVVNPVTESRECHYSTKSVRAMLEEATAELTRQLEEARKDMAKHNADRTICAWTPMDREEMPGSYEGDCGVAWSFIDGGIQDNDLKYCPKCGGEVIDIAAAIKAQGGE
jgi:hypothetical protein